MPDMPEDITLEEMTSILGGPPPAVDTPAEETPPAVETPAEDTPAVEVPAEEAPPAQPADKSHLAFAEMRVKNKQLAETMKGIAEILGVQDTNDESQLLAALQEKITAKQAEKQGLPVEVLQRLQMLETRDHEYTEMQLRQQAATGFQQVKDKFNLDQQALDNFATELISIGKNPLATQYDLLSEYTAMHHDKIVEKKVADAVAAAIAAEQARALKATQHSSTPGRQAGTGDPEPQGKVNSVRELNTWLKSQTS